MTAVGFVSGARAASEPSGWARAAAVASVLLGGALLVVLPELVDAAFYVGVLAAADAALALAGGYPLWSSGGLVVRAGTGVAAGSTVLAVLMQVLVGLPGAPGLGQVSRIGSGLVLGFAGAVLVLLAVDALRHAPGPVPDHPYAL